MQTPAAESSVGASAPARPSVLARLQRGLEALYRVETRLDVRLFVVSEHERARALGDRGRRPREQLLISHEPGPPGPSAGTGWERGELAIGLYLDDSALENLAAHDPHDGLGDHNFADFCLAVEGVSHFIYVALCAAANRPVTALELELQAEVDKFVSCLLLDQEACRPTELRARLYERFRFADDLDGDERARYATANRQAHRYADTLERRYLTSARVPDMLAELRFFYRLPLQAKLAHIARTAA